MVKCVLLLALAAASLLTTAVAYEDYRDYYYQVVKSRIPAAKSAFYTTIHDSLLNKAITQSVDAVQRSVKGIRKLAYYAKVSIDKSSESYKYAALHQASNDSQKIAEFALVADKVSRMLVEYGKISASELEYIDLYGTYLQDGCPFDNYYPCLPSEYRTLNGTCNNLEHRDWGSSSVAFNRLLDADYADDVSKPREYGRYDKLPNPRQTSETLLSILKHSDSVRHHYVSEIFVSFAAFVFRDVSHIPRASGFHGYEIKCCDVTADQKDHECYAALPTRADEYCMEYVRSSNSPREYCLLGRREQLNQASAYLDASPVYGNSDEDLAKIRLPNSYNLTKASIAHELVTKDLKMVAEIFVWYHNSLAEQLNRQNYNWDTEKVFQEARRIVIAVLQHITYSEFLPILLGHKALNKFGLKLEYSDYYNGYTAEDDPGVPNAGGVIMNTLSLLSEVDFSGDHQADVKKMVTGYAKNNPYVSKKPKYMTKDHFDGLALAILQARDHGLAGYQNWREFCNLTTLRRYSDLHGILDRDVLVKLVKLYGKLDDVELIIAGLSEEPEDGALLGPTFACIIGLLFSRIRDGDRFWYENDLPPVAFDEKQLKEIRKSSFSKLLCLHSKIKNIQPNAFLVPDKYRNAQIDCDSKHIDKLNISKFQSDSYSDKVLDKTLEDLFYRVSKSTPHVYKDFKTGGSSGVRVLHSFLKASNRSYQRYTIAHKLEEVTNEFIKTHRNDQKRGLLTLLSKVDVDEYLHELGYTEDVGRCLLEEWKSDSPCDHMTSYRSYSGRCNNLHYPEYGMSLETFTRIRPPMYDDYYKAARRKGSAAKELPSARAISNDIHHDTQIENERYTLMLMQFGQFMDHDLGKSPASTGYHNEVLDCSSCYSNDSVSEECFPIPIPEDDPYFPRKHPITDEPSCMPFTRSMAGQENLGHREQLNQVTSFLDLSAVYGSDECAARELRTFRRGLLRVAPYSRRGREFLPKGDKDDDCRTESKRCFLAGDSRCNEHPGIAVIHTVFLRLHNNVAQTLSHFNRHWDDERLFQETRRITIAVYQRIIYNEFLPAVLGTHAMYRFDLKLEECGYFEDYDKHCDPTVNNEFVNAAFRFGHSLIKPILPRFGKGYGDKLGSVHLRDHFFNPDVITEGNTLDDLVRGFAHVKAEDVDHSLSSEVTDHLFEEKHVKYSGLDLAALNIQRGRDHGLNSYISYLDNYYYKPVTRFEHLKKIFDSQTVHKLKKLFHSFKDIDLFTGGLLEKPLPGGLVGATFGKIIAEQFQKLKRCDRFWHESSDVKLRFSEDQLHEIRKMTFAKLLCDTTGVEELQQYVFEMDDDFRNPKMDCDLIERMDFSKWRDYKHCIVDGVEIPMGRSAPASPCTHCTCTSEGPVCRSVRVTNCYHLTEIYSLNAVKRDQVCAAQCPWTLLSGKRHRTPKHGQNGKLYYDEDDHYRDEEYDYEDGYCSKYDKNCHF